MRNSSIPGGGGNGGGPPRMDGIKGLTPAFIQNANQIDDRIGPMKCRPHRSFIGDADLQGYDLAHIPHDFQETGGDRIAHGDANNPSLGSQTPNQMTTDKT